MLLYVSLFTVDCWQHPSLYMLTQLKLSLYGYAPAQLSYLLGHP